jgi:hypothetical protein
MIEILQDRLNQAEEEFMRYKASHGQILDLEKQKSANFEGQLRDIKNVIKEASENSSNNLLS